MNRARVRDPISPALQCFFQVLEDATGRVKLSAATVGLVHSMCTGLVIAVAGILDADGRFQVLVKIKHNKPYYLIPKRPGGRVPLSRSGPGPRPVSCSY